MTERIDSIDQQKLSSLFRLLNTEIPIAYIQAALTHTSMKTRLPAIETYENYETIGDAVLGLIIVEKIYKEENNVNPGFLTQERSRLVNNKTFTNVSNKLNLNEYILVEHNYQIRNSDLADVLEAIFGVIYLSKGIEEAKKLLEHLWEIFLEAAPPHYDNPIGRLQEFLQKRKEQVPIYEQIARSGSDHAPQFTIQLTISIENQISKTEAVGFSIQNAKETAARLMLDLINDKYQ